MSAFRRKSSSGEKSVVGGRAGTLVSNADTAVGRGFRGTKPFVNGQTLVSSGLSELDALMGGGLALGSLVLVEAARPGGHVELSSSASQALVDDLMRYFIAEAVAASHCGCVIMDEPQGFIEHQLPLELSLAQKQVKQQLTQMSVSSTAANSDSGDLKIAWQYEKYLTPTTSNKSPQTLSQRFCHSYDLSRRMHPEMLEANRPYVLALETVEKDTLEERYNVLLEWIERQIRANEAQRVVRIVLRGFASPSWFVHGNGENCHVALVRFLRRLRALIRGAPVVCMLSGSFVELPRPLRQLMRHDCDYLFEVQSFAGEQDMLPAELTEFQGLFHVRKLAQLHALTSYRPETVKYGIKRERRKMKIEKLHLPPEGSRSSSTSSTSSLAPSAAKSTGSGGCGSGPSNVHDPLAF